MSQVETGLGVSDVLDVPGDPCPALPRPVCSQTLFVELGCNGLFGAGQGSMIAPPDPNRRFSVQKAELVVFNRDVQELLTDFEMLVDVVKVRMPHHHHHHRRPPCQFIAHPPPPPCKELGEGEQRGYQALFTVNEMVNLCDPSDPGTFPKARRLAHDFFSQRNGQSQHTVHAMGHCHIDSGLILGGWGGTLRSGR